MKTITSIERWPLARPFTIARGSKSEAEVVVATISDGTLEGRGECVPYPRYGESAAQVAAAIDGFDGPFERDALLRQMPAGAARNAIDCALWDLAAKRGGCSAWQLAGIEPPANAVTTAYTLSLDSVAKMGEHAAVKRERPLLKLKLGSGDIDMDVQRLQTVRRSAPGARLIVDANEGWNGAALERFMEAAVEAQVELVEQPLPDGADGELATRNWPIPIAADESIRDGGNLEQVAERYQAINIKLDKSGGLTRSLALARQATELGLGIMVGCMVATSLAMAPALLLAGFAQVVDLDGPLLLNQDRSPGLRYSTEGLGWTAGVWGTP